MSADRSSLPVWTYPVVLALLGIVLFSGDLTGLFRIAVGVESLLVISYMLMRSVRPPSVSRAVARLLPLFPAHLLLLLAVTMLPGEAMGLVVLWMLIPLASVLYDLVASWRAVATRKAMSILSILYCIIWAVIFALLERVIVLGRGLSGGASLSVMVLLGLLGLGFISIGIYRHRRVNR